MSGIKLNHRTKILIENTCSHAVFVGPVQTQPGQSYEIELNSAPLSRLGRLQSAGHIKITKIIDEDGNAIAMLAPAVPMHPLFSTELKKPAEVEWAEMGAPVPAPAPDPAPAEPEEDVVAAFAALSNKPVEPVVAEGPKAEEPAAPVLDEQALAKRRAELDDLKVADLRAILDERKVKTDNMRKPDLIEAIISSDPKA